MTIRRPEVAKRLGADHPDEGLHLALLFLVLGIFIWSGWDIREQQRYWGIHILPVVGAALVLCGLYPYFHFSRRAYLATAGFLALLLVGAHYGETHVPIFVQAELKGWAPAHSFDRLAHLLQGIVPAMLLGEILEVRGIVTSRPWRFWIVVACTLALSAAYEIVEWLTASLSETRPTDFVTEAGGATWDTQWDMAMALGGAILSAFLSATHKGKAVASQR